MSLFIYADPPYIGMAKKHYDCPEVDYLPIFDSLVWGRKWEWDGWAVSCNPKDLATILPMIERSQHEYRIAAWVKPFASFKPNVNPAYTWEPVIYRTTVKRDRAERTVRDHLAASISLKKGLVGAKPRQFAFWLFELLGMKAGDDLIDLYPGPLNTMTNYWQEYQRQTEGLFA